MLGSHDFLKHRFTLLLSALLILGGGSVTGQTVDPDYVDGQVFIRYKQNHSRIKRGKQQVIASFPQLAKIQKTYQLSTVEAPFHVLKHEGLQRTVKLEFRAHDQVGKLLKELRKNPDVEYAERVPLYKSFYTPNDPYGPNSNSMYWLGRIRAAEAWDVAKGNKDIVVAISDDGLDISHEDLQGALWVNPGEIAGNGIDDDNNGYVDDIHGWDASRDDNDPSPEPGGSHGTHVGGTAGAHSDNGIGMASIGFGVSLMGAKSTNSNQYLTHTFESVVYVVASGHADVLNMSWGGGGYSQTYQNLYDQANAQGIVCVAAAGNDNVSRVAYPAGYSGVIAVASSTSSDAKSSFSNYGSWIDITAPGSNITATVPGNRYQQMSGTSMASPVVAGLCGLMLSANPELTPAEVLECLQNTAKNIDNVNSNYIGQLGAGRIDAYEAVKCAAASFASPPEVSFSAFTGTCSPEVRFENSTKYKVDDYLWDFGDGNTSTEENPTHTYASSGTYSVSLKATNEHGEDTELKSDFIVIDVLSTPDVQDITACDGQAPELVAQAEHGIYWYDAESGGNRIGEGESFEAVGFMNDFTAYAEHVIPQPLESVGPSDNSFGEGAYFTANDAHGLLFDVSESMTLKSVKVFSESAGNRKIEVLQNGTIMASTTVNIPEGENRVELNFDLEAGNGYFIKVTGDMVGLYRNSEMADYPFTVGNLVTITETDVEEQGYPNYYYFFYDWEVQKKECRSARVPVKVTFGDSPDKPDVDVDGSDLKSSVQGDTYQWYFDGEPIQGATSRTHQPASSGSYQVEVFNAAGCGTLSDEYFHSSTGIEETAQLNLQVYPNPAQHEITLVSDQSDMQLGIYNSVGQLIQEVQVNSNVTLVEINALAAGIYYIKPLSGDKGTSLRFIKSI